MDPSKIKLNLPQKIKYFFSVLNDPLMLVLAIIFAIFAWLMFVASLFPVIVKYKVVDAIVCFGISSLIHVFAALPFILAFGFWVDDQTSGDLRRDFVNNAEDKLKKLKKNILDNVIDNEILK